MDPGELKILGTLGGAPIVYQHSQSALFSQSITCFAAGLTHIVAVTGDSRVHLLAAIDQQEHKEGDQKERNTFDWTPLFPVDFSLKIKQVACGNSHILLLTETGTVYSLGSNERGQLGVGHAQEVISLAPTNLVVLPSKIKQISCGALSSAALAESGDVWTWGDASFGKLGYWAANGSDNVQSSPKMVTGWDPGYQPPVIKEVSMGGNISCFLADSGFLYTCGSAANGGMALDPVRAKAAGGNPLLKFIDSHPCIAPPKLVELPSSVRHVSAGHDYVLAVTKGGRMLVWGNGERGTLGNGRKEVIFEPYYLKKFRTVRIRHVYAATNHSCVITDGQVLYSWGAEGQMQIGAKPEALPEALLAPVETFQLRGFKCSQVVVGPTVTMCLCETAERVDHSSRILGTDDTEINDAADVKSAESKQDIDAPPDLAAYRAPPRSHLGKWIVACALLFVLLALAVYRL